VPEGPVEPVGPVEPLAPSAPYAIKCAEKKVPEPSAFPCCKVLEEESPLYTVKST
jgi:hypothetical protein